MWRQRGNDQRMSPQTNGAVAGGPLRSLRILAVEQYGAGPYATQLLRDLGAEVIKVENPADGGDIGRRIPTPFAHAEGNLFFETFNRGKKSIALDLSTAQDYDVFCRLVRDADVVFHNNRGDVARKLKFDYASLRHLNPAIVCAALTAYGSHGPQAALPGFDYLFQAKAGWMSLTGDPDSYPVKSGPSLVDFSTGIMAALAVVSAVMGARERNEGGDVDVSLYDTALNMLTYVGTWSMTAGFEPERLAHSAHPSVVPFQEFATSDGHLVVACVKDKFFKELCDILSIPELAERFPTSAERGRHRAQVVDAVAERFKTASTAHWITTMRGRVPSEPVATVGEALEGGAIPRERGLLVEYDHPTLGRVKTLGTPIAGWWGPSVAEPGPQFDENGSELRAESPAPR